jgi:hypothetical protein
VSNRRRPRNPGLPLQPIGTRPGGRTGLPPELTDFTLWTDTPPAQYKATTLDWIVRALPERGRMNVCVCDTCDQGVLCFDLHPGTTPYTVSHATLGDPDCGGTCYSRMYSGTDAAVAKAQHGGPSHEWYRPSVFELGQSSRAVRDHVQMGGLLVRPYDKPGRAKLMVVDDIADPAAPTLEELSRGRDVIGFLS